MKLVTRIIATLIIVFMVSRLLWPNFFILPKIDVTSLILFILALVTFFFGDIFNLLKKIKLKFIIRFLVPTLCIGLIVIRFLKPELKFDSITINLLIITVIVLVIPDIKDLLLRIRKVKKGDFELEVGEAISELADKTSRVEDSVEEVTSPNTRYSGISDEITRRIADAASDPRGAFLVLAIEIEGRIRQLANQLNIVEANRIIPLIRVLEILTERGFIGREVISIFRDFWAIRNRVAHGVHYELERGRLYELVDLGMRILRLLPSDIQGNTMQE